MTIDWRKRTRHHTGEWAVPTNFGSCTAKKCNEDATVEIGRRVRIFLCPDHERALDLLIEAWSEGDLITEFRWKDP